MKSLRLTFLVALTVSVFAAPQAFGGGKKGQGGSLTPDRLHTRAYAPPEWDITCPNGRTAVCIGSESDCLFMCDLFCGTPSGSCQTVNN